MQELMNKLCKNTWITTFGSGTLKYAHELGAATHDLYLEERVSFTYGKHFESASKTRLTTGVPLAAGDCHAFTEGLWCIRRRRALGATGEYSLPLWIHLHEDTGIVSGLGVVLDIPPEWLPSSRTIFAIVAPATRNSEYSGVINAI